MGVNSSHCVKLIYMLLDLAYNSQTAATGVQQEIRLQQTLPCAAVQNQWGR